MSHLNCTFNAWWFGKMVRQICTFNVWWFGEIVWQILCLQVGSIDRVYPIFAFGISYSKIWTCVVQYMNLSSIAITYRSNILFTPLSKYTLTHYMIVFNGLTLTWWGPRCLNQWTLHSPGFRSLLSVYAISSD